MHLVDRMARNIEHGRFERSLSALTAVGALVTTAEIYFEHYKASFGNKMMWSPIVVTPPVVVAGIGGVFSKKWAKTWLPLTAGIYTLNGALGEYYHARGVSRRPGGWRLATYNVPMGPPIMAPGTHDHRRRDGIARRAAPPRTLKRCRISPSPIIFPTSAPTGNRRTSRGSPGSAEERLLR